MRQLSDKYEAQKDIYIKEGIPFMSYLHAGGWMFMRLDEVKLAGHEQSGDPVNIGYRAKRSRICVGTRGRNGFEKIVDKLRKAGTLIDVTYYTPEVVSTFDK